MSKIGRNDPCPCGSGKKYKNCCGITGDLKIGIREPNYFEINREIAYRGKIGQRRREFCIRYLEVKKEKVINMQEGQAEMAEIQKAAIGCQKGCCYCCSHYVEATIQECEAIIYYLYEHDDVLMAFLKKYPKWREEIRNNGDLYKQCGKFYQIKPTKENIVNLKKQIDDDNRRYYHQNISCPFLSDDLCSIYEVRPYGCVSLISLSPKDYCKPGSLNEPVTIKAFEKDIQTDCSFYYGTLESPIFTCMQIAVYELLRNGTYYYKGARIAGLENLHREFCTDPDVYLRLRKYGVIN